MAKAINAIIARIFDLAIFLSSFLIIYEDITRDLRAACIPLHNQDTIDPGQGPYIYRFPLLGMPGL
jgi:hypothetical protein